VAKAREGAQDKFEAALADMSIMPTMAGNAQIDRQTEVKSAQKAENEASAST